MGPVNGDTAVEDLVRDHPKAVGFLVRKGLPCLVCGEPVWGTLGQLAVECGRTPGEGDHLIAELNSYLERGES